MNKEKLMYMLIAILSVIVIVRINTVSHTVNAETGDITDSIPPVTITVELEKPVETPAPVNLGEFKLTAYCSCSKCCGKWASNRPDGQVIGSTGEVLSAGYSIAVDPDVIPYGTEVIINGHTYKAMDCGGSIKGNRIDVYFNSHSDALEFGVQTADLFLK